MRRFNINGNRKFLKRRFFLFKKGEDMIENLT